MEKSKKKNTVDETTKGRKKKYKHTQTNVPNREHCTGKGR